MVLEGWEEAVEAGTDILREGQGVNEGFWRVGVWWGKYEGRMTVRRG